MAFTPALGQRCTEKAGMELLQQTDWQTPKAESSVDLVGVRGQGCARDICSSNSSSLVINSRRRFFLHISHHISNISNSKKSCASNLQRGAEIGGVVGVVVIVLADLVLVIQRAVPLGHPAELQRQDQGSGKEKL